MERCTIDPQKNQRILFSRYAWYRGLVYFYVFAFDLVDAIKWDALVAYMLKSLQDSIDFNLFCVVAVMVLMNVCETILGSVSGLLLSRYLPPIHLLIFSFMFSTVSWALFDGQIVNTGFLVSVLVYRALSAREEAFRQCFIPSAYCLDYSISRTGLIGFMDMDPRSSLVIQLCRTVIVPAAKIVLLAFYPQVVFGVQTPLVVGACIAVVILLACSIYLSLKEEEETEEEEQRRSHWMFVAKEHNSVKSLESIFNAFWSVRTFDYPIYVAYAYIFLNYNLTYHSVYIYFTLHMVRFVIALIYQAFNDLCLDLNEFTSVRTMLFVRYTQFFLSIVSLVNPIISKFILLYVTVYGASSECTAQLMGASLCLSAGDGAFEYIIRQLVEQERRWRCRHVVRCPSPTCAWYDIFFVFSHVPRGALFSALLVCVLSAASLWLLPLISIVMFSSIIIAMYVFVVMNPIERAACSFL
jgi:hypothetical protein